MAEPNPDHWALTHMRWLALSRWDNEGGASPSRLTSGSADPSSHSARTKVLVLHSLQPGFASSAPPKDQTLR